LPEIQYSVNNEVILKQANMSSVTVSQGMQTQGYFKICIRRPYGWKFFPPTWYFGAKWAWAWPTLPNVGVLRKSVTIFPQFAVITELFNYLMTKNLKHFLSKKLFRLRLSQLLSGQLQV